MTQIRVFLLEDHEIVRHGITALLHGETDLIVVGEAGTAQDALLRIPLTRPDVAVLDGQLPDGSGVGVCRELVSLAPSVRCLILTGFDEDTAFLAAVLAGAAGYLLKEAQGRRLAPAVRTVAAGQSLLDPDRTARLRVQLKPEPDSDGRFASLSSRERQVLALIADGFTNRQIGDELTLSERTVKHELAGLFAKLGMHRRSPAAVFDPAHRDPPPGPTPAATEGDVR